MAGILQFVDLRLNLHSDTGRQYNLLDDISFDVEEGTALGLVGESGCGKSMTSLAAMRLLPPAAKAVGGRIMLHGQDILTKTEEEMYKVRGKQAAMIFQEPMTALNPVLTIGFQVEEMIRRHEPRATAKELRERVIGLLDKVGIPLPEKRIKNYPHQFSGGMRQRVMIAMAIACNPGLLIADEPTTALDVTIQAQVLNLMTRLRRSEGSALMLITHNLGVVAETCDRVAVMYAGQIVEQGDTVEVFKRPAHPYTRGLLQAIPTLHTKPGELYTIPGTVPSVNNFTSGCRYAPRCPMALEECTVAKPREMRLSTNHSVACWREEGVV